MKETSRLLWKFIIVLAIASTLLSVNITAFYYLTIAIHLPAWALQESLINFVIVLVSFEFIFILSVSLIFFQLLQKYNNQRTAIYDFSDILMEVMSHKLGNFIAGQKVNLALIDSECKNESVFNMRKSIQIMEEDLNEILSSLMFIREKTLSFGSLPDLPGIVQTEKEKSESLTDPKLHKNKKIIMRTDGFKIKRPEHALVISLLLENAFKHSASKIKIRAGLFSNMGYLYISNDISEKSHGGMGIGLSIAAHICAKQNCKLKLKENPSDFNALLIFPSTHLKVTNIFTFPHFGNFLPRHQSYFHDFFTKVIRKRAD